MRLQGPWYSLKSCRIDAYLLPCLIANSDATSNIQDAPWLETGTVHVYQIGRLVES
jgi:hypothetical protein